MIFRNKIISIIYKITTSFSIAKLQCMKISNTVVDSQIFSLKVKQNGYIILRITNALIKNVILQNEGHGNEISCKGRVKNCEINFYGNDNKINIDLGVQLNNVKITIRGNACQINIGENSTVGSGYFICMGLNNTINIGQDCMFSENIEIWATDSHPIYDNGSKFPYNISRPIEINSNVWLGKNSVVTKGVEIGMNSIIGISAVVSRSIPPNSVAVGNPAKVVKQDITWKREFIQI
jgi:acetyltransferase-like isoleucine patch superfamily enzyme